MFLVFWITYRVFLYNPSEVDHAVRDTLVSPAGSAGPSAARGEARYLFNRAREFAKAGRTDQAIGLLKRVVTRYKMTQTATEARMVAGASRSHIPPAVPEGPAVVADRSTR